jgi:hypothetical protein
MGFTPREVDQMSVWEFNAATGGVMKANTPEDQQGLNTEQIAALASALKDAPATWH